MLSNTCVSKAMNKTVVIGYNTCHYAWLLRRSLIKALTRDGWSVFILAPEDNYTERLEALGAKHIPVPMRMNVNPATDFFLLGRLLWRLRQVRPAVYLGYTVKPNVYGGLACRALGIPSVHNVAGLGTVFIEDTWITRVVRLLYRLGLSGAVKVFFQNPDDMAQFLDQNLVVPEAAERLPGSGVDTSQFSPVERDASDKIFRFLLPARLLWEKGIGEYINASRELRANGYSVDCQLVGFLGADNRTAIRQETIAQWQAEGLARYIGSTDDIRPILGAADCVVLPSYREGTPRSLLEAASMALPVITTDAVGCREVVDDGVNGFLCRIRDSADLAEKMARMMKLSSDERKAMGKQGRQKMIREFDESVVIDRYLQVVENIGAQTAGRQRL